MPSALSTAARIRGISEAEQNRQEFCFLSRKNCARSMRSLEKQVQLEGDIPMCSLADAGITGFSEALEAEYTSRADSTTESLGTLGTTHPRGK